ncbi:MAG: CpaF family protein [Bacteroidota bacterium]
MFLRSRLQGVVESGPRVLETPAAAPRRAAKEDPFRILKTRVHRLLIEEMKQGTDEAVNADEIRILIRSGLEKVSTERGQLLGRSDRDRLIEEIYNDMLGLGPLEPLLREEEITEVMVNNPRQIFIERAGKIEKSEAVFYDDAHLLRIIDKIVSRVGRRIDESSPMCDARLPDGSRVNAIIPPLAIDGPVLTIRKFRKDPLKVVDLMEYQSLNQAMAEFLRACVEAKLNILISGGTGSGKTTLLNVMSSFIPVHERLITIEDAAELQLQQEHVIRLETRPTNIENVGGVDQAELLRNSLRMRPDRIILGEVRGREALSMLQAMNTGHEGSLATIHANTTRDALSRLETMVLMAGMDLPLRAIREQIASAINLIVQTERSSDGVRRVTSLSEIVGMEGDIIQTQDIYVFQRQGITTEGDIVGQYLPTGIRPKYLDRIYLKGIELPLEIFSGGAR